MILLISIVRTIYLSKNKGFPMTNNPLQQYFRRPSIYIRLPSDYKFYNNQIIELTETKELPVYPMTAIDEITSKTPDALFNGQAVVDIIHSCIPNIKNAWHINIIDLETILIAIRVASNGEYMEIESKCPKCEEDSKYDINLIELLRTQGTVNYDDPMIVGDLTIKFKPLTYAETNRSSIAQYELQKVIFMLDNEENTEENRKVIKDTVEKLNQLSTDIICNTIECIITPETVVTDRKFIKEYLENCSRAENKMIKDHSSKLKEDNQIKPLKIKCIHCEHQYEHKLVLNVSDFFE
jgi:hypothetical protein